MSVECFGEDAFEHDVGPPRAPALVLALDRDIVAEADALLAVQALARLLVECGRAVGVFRHGVGQRLGVVSVPL